MEKTCNDSALQGRNPPAEKKITADHLIQDFLGLQRELGRRPNLEEFRKRHHTNKVLVRVFGGRGWSAMLQYLDDKVFQRGLTLEHLIEDYIELERELARTPTQEDFRRKCHSVNVLVRMFGKNPWSTFQKTVEMRASITQPPTESIALSECRLSE